MRWSALTVVRTVEVRAPSARDEAILVGRLAVAILCAAGVLIDLGAGASRAGGDATRLLPFQQLFSSLAPEGQLMFRELQEGLLEAENLRTDAGKWPSVDALRATGAPPFSGGRDAWTSRTDGVATSYVGVPADPKRPVWMLLVSEAKEHTGGGGRVTLDEQHRKLPTGEVYHVSIWTRADASRLPEGVIDRPFQEGWTQILVAAPPVSQE